ncbi:N-formyl peptide receptor 2 [Echinops telfairi]|uniref:N-formyl peptide receptor 2 n=1 Tax=Echinops telfairi TaxID=9371 RepID=A0ABM0IY76_ECHTE|nr:N-formyl peptide receptor 2 [Echinops telfairi]
METNFSTALNQSAELDEPADYTALHTLLLVMLGITFVLGILGNGLVIWVAGFRMPRTVTTITYLNLAVADFSFSATLPFRIVWIIKKHWPFGWFLCKFIMIMVEINLYESIFLITLIALDRCCCVLHPVWSQNHRTVGLAKKVITGVWLLALFFSLPIIIFTNTRSDEDGYTHCDICFESLLGDTIEEIEKVAIPLSISLVTIRFIFAFNIPVAVITVCYGLVATNIRKRGLVNSRRPLRILTAIGVAFFLCWFPFQLVALLITVWSTSQFRETLAILFDLTKHLAFFNSCLNPVLYVFVGQNFQKRLIQSLPASLERALQEDPDQTGDTASTSMPPPLDVELQAR